MNMKVYKAINAVQSELARDGISKNRENSFDRYKFRGIDDVYNAVSPLLAKHGLCILPRVLSREVVERESQKGGALFYVTVEAEFDFVSAEDGSKHTVKTYGEAMDRGDKATNKAMSAAYKYAAFQAFAIPTEGDNDADAATHEIKSSSPAALVAQSVSAGMDSARKDELENMALYMVEAHKAADDAKAIELYFELTDNDEKAYLWHLLRNESKLRAAIKANGKKAA
jgi:hypothetical protein